MRSPFAVAYALCTPGMGVNLSACACPNADRWCESPLYMNPVPLFDDGNESTSQRQAPSASYGVSRGHHREVVSLSADRQVKEAGMQSYEPTNSSEVCFFVLIWV